MYVQEEEKNAKHSNTAVRAHLFSQGSAEEGEHSWVLLGKAVAKVAVKHTRNKFSRPHTVSEMKGRHIFTALIQLLPGRIQKVDTKRRKQA